MTVEDIEKQKDEINQKLYEYITLLENSNNTLLTTLKQCVHLLSQFSEAVPDPDAYNNLLKHLEAIIQAGERVVIKKTLH